MTWVKPLRKTNWNVGMITLIPLTYELEQDSTLPLLDTLITRKPDGHMSFGIYRKPTHTDQYLMYDSHHPLVHKAGVVRTLCDRNNNITTDSKDKDIEHSHIKSALNTCGYPDWIIKRHRVRKPPTTTPSDKPETKGLAVLPYVKGVSERIQRVLQKRLIKVALKPVNTIRQAVIHPKDKLPITSKSGVVYQIPCGTCDQCYIGETGRPLGTRLSEHKSEVEKVTSQQHYTRSARLQSQGDWHKSAITDHVCQDNCHINWDDTKVLDQDSNRPSRLIREALAINSHNTMNRDQGNYFLSSVYKPLIGGAAPGRGKSSFRLKKMADGPSKRI